MAARCKNCSAPGGNASRHSGQVALMPIAFIALMHFLWKMWLHGSTSASSGRIASKQMGAGPVKLGVHAHDDLLQCQLSCAPLAHWSHARRAAWTLPTEALLTLDRPQLRRSCNLRWKVAILWPLVLRGQSQAADAVTAPAGHHRPRLLPRFCSCSTSFCALSSPLFGRLVRSKTQTCTVCISEGRFAGALSGAPEEVLPMIARS